MAKASKKSPEEKLRVVLSVLRGELSAAAAGRRAGVSEQTVHHWGEAVPRRRTRRLGPGPWASFGSRERAGGRERGAQGSAGRGPCSLGWVN